MNRSVTLPLKLCVVLDAAEIRIQATGGIPHDVFWRQVDAENDDALEDNPGESPAIATRRRSCQPMRSR
jgi:hypothetical protein